MFDLFIQFLPLAILLLFFTRFFLLHKQGKRPPVSEKMLRPPGESLRNRLDELNETMIVALAYFAMVSCIFSAIVKTWSAATTSTGMLVTLLFGILCAGVLIFLGRRVYRSVMDYRNYNLGFSGERFVGEALNKLMLDGCQVFHDYPADPKWNIDHIVVSSTGVFAIETKARRKGELPPGFNNHVVTYDGQSLNFPGGRELKMLEQTRINASWLSGQLSSAIGESVSVTPILTIPGWWIERKSKDGIPVLNHKEIRGFILNRSGTILSSQKIQRIVHQLDQKCRDVEF
ncbi:MAG: nuclease-related domain-containing protein [Verrucomicrobiota bacterium]